MIRHSRLAVGHLQAARSLENKPRKKQSALRRVGEISADRMTPLLVPQPGVIL
jgi:hypothetical protein